MRGIEFTIKKQTRSGGQYWHLKMGRRLLQAMRLCGVLLLASWSDVASAQCSLVCNDDLNISLPGTSDDCELELTIDMLLEDPTSCNSPLEVTLMNLQSVPLPSPVVSASHIGQMLLFSVEETNSGNSCWGTILVEDKLGPDHDGCDDVFLPCIADTDPTTLGGDAQAPDFDDCSAIQSIDYTDIISNYNCTGNSPALTSIILRTWTAVDVLGNVSNCEQFINVTRVSLADFTPVCPDNVTMECTAQTPNTDPSVTGYPTIEVGGVVYDVVPGADNFCELAASYSDEPFNICGGGTKILRTWNIYDWCLPTNPSNGNPFTCIQVIKIEDTTNPVVICPPPIVHDAAANGCLASLNLPAANASDACSAFDVKILTPFGVVDGNGGLLLNVPVGTHTITYVAEDGCGNLGTCQTTLTIEDNSPPVAICDEHTTVSISGDGTAIVAATTFDDGSTDNCEIDYFEVRRMPSNCQAGTPFDEYVTFNCCDVGEEGLMVAVRIFDYAGNVNQCMVEVEVQDKIDPQVTCPPNKTIECQDQVPVVQAPNIIDNCPGATWVVNEINQVDNCGVGEIIRNYTVTDVGGLTAGCTQVIFVVNSFPFNENDIVWPLDYSTDVCGASLEINDLPVGFDMPDVSEDACDMVAVTHTDQPLPTNPPACYKVLRKWIVIDWCQYNANMTNSPGYWEHTQVLKVEDNEDPVLTCPPNVSVESFDANCLSEVVTVPFVGVDDCSEEFEYDTQIDYFADGAIDLAHDGPNASGAFPFGNHTVSITVEDLCGNSSNCTINVTVTDGKKPTPVCHGLAVELMPDPAGGGMIQLNAEMFDAGSYDNCTDPDDLVIDITPSFFDCDDVGANAVFLYVTDEAGNTDFCETSVIIQDNMVICPDPLVASVSGAIATQAGAGLTNVSIGVSGNGPSTSPIMTDADGHFMFDDLDLGFDYTFTPAHNADQLNGVTTFDIVLMTRHILNTEQLDSPYKIIAADVNNSGSVTTADIVALRRVILQMDPVFLNNTSWRFVDAAHVFPDPTDPFEPEFNEFYNINDLVANVMGVDFVAVKIGDVNGTASTDFSGASADDRNLKEELTFIVDDQNVLAGQTFRVAFRANNFINLLGYQFALQFDTEAAQLEDIETGDLTSLTKTNFGLALLDEGIITTSWDITKNTLHDNNTILFTLVFKANTNTTVSNILHLMPSAMLPEAYQANGNGGLDLLDIGLEFENESELGSGFELFQNQPNPFRETTQIGFNLPEAGKATLTVYDLSGKVLTVKTADFAAGYNEVSLGKVELGTAGVLFYKLETPGHTATRRMVRM